MAKKEVINKSKGGSFIIKDGKTTVLREPTKRAEAAPKKTAKPKGSNKSTSTNEAK